MRKLISALALLVGMAVAAPAFAGESIYLKLDGIQGESKDKQHQVEIKAGKLVESNGKQLPDGEYLSPADEKVTVKDGAVIRSEKVGPEYRKKLLTPPVVKVPPK
jgi:hypothetical protein